MRRSRNATAPRALRPSSTSTFCLDDEPVRSAGARVRRRERQRAQDNVANPGSPAGLFGSIAARLDAVAQATDAGTGDYHASQLDLGGELPGLPCRGPPVSPRPLPTGRRLRQRARRLATSGRRATASRPRPAYHTASISARSRLSRSPARSSTTRTTTASTKPARAGFAGQDGAASTPAHRLRGQRQRDRPTQDGSTRSRVSRLTRRLPGLPGRGGRLAQTLPEHNVGRLPMHGYRAG